MCGSAESLKWSWNIHPKRFCRGFMARTWRDLGGGLDSQRHMIWSKVPKAFEHKGHVPSTELLWAATAAGLQKEPIMRARAPQSASSHNLSCLWSNCLTMFLRAAAERPSAISRLSLLFFWRKLSKQLCLYINLMLWSWRPSSCSDTSLRSSSTRSVPGSGFQLYLKPSNDKAPTQRSLNLSNVSSASAAPCVALCANRACPLFWWPDANEPKFESKPQREGKKSNRKTFFARPERPPGQCLKP